MSKTIVISGSRSNIGKTFMAEKMLGSLQNWSALKVTTVRGGSGCPRNTDCGVCDGLEDDFNIVTDKNIINQKGTDTARLKRAGAKKVVWLKANSKGLRPGLKKALYQLRDSEGIIIEGTSVLKYIKPDMAIFLKENMSPAKLDARKARERADLIINV